MDIAEAAIGAATDFANTAYANRLQTRAAHQAQDFSAQQYATRYQTQVQDLKKAGLNPMLAYMQSPGSAPSGVMAQQSKASTPEAILTTANAAKVNEEKENIKLERKNIEAMQDRLNREIAKIGNEVMEIDQKIKSGRASQAETEMRTELVRTQVELTKIQAALAAQQYNINVPEEIASGTSSALGAAHVSRGIKPLIDALGGILKMGK